MIFHPAGRGGDGVLMEALDGSSCTGNERMVEKQGMGTMLSPGSPSINISLEIKHLLDSIKPYGVKERSFLL